MQVDPSHRRTPAAWPRSGPWRSAGTRFALLPLALGLLAAGLLTACTTGTSALTATPTSSRPVPLLAVGGNAALQPLAPGPFRFELTTLTHAEQGDVDAMYRLALMHETGHGEVAQDRVEMLRWLALASKLGHGPASYKLFRHYEQQPNGSARALRFKELASRQGYYGPTTTSSSR